MSLRRSPICRASDETDRGSIERSAIRSFRYTCVPHYWNTSHMCTYLMMNARLIGPSPLKASVSL